MTKHVSPGIRVSSLVHSEHVRNLDWFLNSGHVAFSLQLFLDYLSFVKVCCPLKPRGCRCKGNLLFLLVLDLLSRRVIEMASGGDSALEEAITKLFEAPRNGTKLMGALVALLVTYMVSVLKVKSVDEINSDDPDEMEEAAKEAWQESEKVPLPAVHASRIRKWAGEVKMKPTVETPLGGSSVGVIVDADLHKAARAEVADMDLTPMEKEKAVKDMAAQGLTCARIITLSLSIMLGKVCKLGASEGMRYGEDPSILKPVKEARKANAKILPTIIKGKNFADAAAYFSNLMTRFASDSLIEESALIGTWWAETSSCFAADKDLMFEYIEAYFEKYAGRGLPVLCDTALVLRLRGGSASGGIAKEDFNKLKTRIGELESQNASHKAKIAELVKKAETSTKPTATEQAERRAKVTCHICGEKGHYQSECPLKKKKEGEE